VSDYADEPHEAYEDEVRSAPAGSRLGPTSYVLIGLLVGALAAIVLLWVLLGNPFSSANEVVYTDVVVGSVTAAADQLCWAEDPDRRDSPQTCAILALDPEIAVPEPGDVVTIGLVDFRTPNGAEFQQVVHLAPAQDPDLGASPAPTGTGPGGTDPTDDATSS
jgi:hypothetical protein